MANQPIIRPGDEDVVVAGHPVLALECVTRRSTLGDDFRRAFHIRLHRGAGVLRRYIRFRCCNGRADKKRENERENFSKHQLLLQGIARLIANSPSERET